LEDVIMKKQTKVWLGLVLGLSLLALGSACSKEPTTTNRNSESKGSGVAYSGPTGTVTGVIAFNGTAPAPKKIDSSADAACAQGNPNLTTEDTVVTDGKLANVFVYIKDGTTADGKKVGDFKWDAPAEPAKLDQKGCAYKPHVMGIQVNQKLSISNSDATQHNIHPMPKKNPEWNESQSNGQAPIVKTFAVSEVLIPVKCNQHPWMKAYVGVMKTPFFAVSATDGTFTLDRVPAGKYTIAAWKEGGAAGTEKTIEVTVAANGSVKADFAFGDAAPAAASNNGGLKVMPALDLPMLGRH
jgi:hypothetical protein